MSDPTREEMLTLLASLSTADEADDFDREEAIYWFASDWHTGQWSNLYAALCASPYHPGPACNGPSGLAALLYESLYESLRDSTERTTP